MDKKENILFEEWKECRNAIGRFDNYLLAIRTSVFASFTAIAGVILLLEKSDQFKFLLEIEESSSFGILSLIALFILSLLSFITLSFILDRYYESLLYGAVIRSCIIEIIMYNKITIGLSSQIEGLKQRRGTKLNKIYQFLENANNIILILYIIMYAFVSFMLICYYYLLIKKIATAIIIILFTSIPYIIYVFLCIRAHKSLTKTINKEREYRKLISSASIIYTRDQIESKIDDICELIIKENIIEKNINQIIIIPLMERAIFINKIFKNKFEAHIKNKNLSVNIKEYPLNIKNKDVLIEFTEDFIKDKIAIIVDSLIDTGNSIRDAKKSIKICPHKKLITFAAIVKRDLSKNDLPDYYCYKLNYSDEYAKNNWLFGFGLDRREFRDCDYIGEAEGLDLNFL